MSYPDPHGPQQQPPPRPYPPAPPVPPGPYGYGYPPNGGLPPAQPYGAPQQPPYYAPPAATSQPAAKPEDGNSRRWQILDSLLFLVGDGTKVSSSDNARHRVKVQMLTWGVALVGFAIMMLIIVLI